MHTYLLDMCLHQSSDMYLYTNIHICMLYTCVWGYTHIMTLWCHHPIHTKPWFHTCKHSPESHEEAIWMSWSINHRRSTVVRNIQSSLRDNHHHRQLRSGSINHRRSTMVWNIQSSIKDNGPHHKTQPLNCQRGQLYRPPPRGRLLRDCVFCWHACCVLSDRGLT